MATSKESTCYRCADRKVTEDYNCHIHCEKYAKFKEEMDAINSAERDFTKNFIIGGKHKRRFYKQRVEDAYNV